MKTRQNNEIKRILIGGSAGSLEQVEKLLCQSYYKDLPPIVYICHMNKEEGVNQMCKLLNNRLPLTVSVATNGGKLEKNNLYISPAAYHLLLEDEGDTFRLYDDEPFLSSKPSINLLFMSCCGHESLSTLAILISGANTDGAEGLNALRLRGAQCAIADPDYCQFGLMPRAAIATFEQHKIIPFGRERQWLESAV